MGGIKKTVRSAALLFLCAVLITAVTGCWMTESAWGWQADSEDLVWGRILQMQQGDENAGGFLGKYVPEGQYGYLRESFLRGNAEGQWSAYTHQTGLQGTLYGALNLVLKMVVSSAKVRWAALRFGNSALCVAAMLLMAGWIRKKAGLAAAAAGFSCVFLVPYSLMSLPNLYWATWTLAVPFVVSATECEWISREQKHLIAGAALIGAATFLRCLCGFEFISSVMIAAELPVLWELLCAEKHRRGFWLRGAFLVAAFQLAAFGLSFGLWMIQDFLYLRDWTLVKADVLATIAKRTGAFAEWMPADEAYAASLQVPRLKILTWYFSEAIYAKVFPVAGLMLLAVFSYILLQACERIFKKKSAKTARMGRWLIFALASTAGPASWFLLASGHSFIHRTINEVMWLFPTLPLLLAAIAGNVAALVSMLRKDEL